MGGLDDTISLCVVLKSVLTHGSSEKVRLDAIDVDDIWACWHRRPVPTENTLPFKIHPRRQGRRYSNFIILHS